MDVKGYLVGILTIVGQVKNLAEPVHIEFWRLRLNLFVTMAVGTRSSAR